jgi:16S rRNA (guanine(1405)-N(7))-methyltransferase
MMDDARLDEVVAQVISGARYRQIHPGLVRKIAAQELSKGRSQKEAVKEIRSKLHQVGGAYQEKSPDYVQLLNKLNGLPQGLEELRPYCLDVMRFHASTRERLPFLAEFFSPLREKIGEVSSILDLACGLNPLALSWMPFAARGKYIACDIYADMVRYLNGFFQHARICGEARLCDLTTEVPSQPVELVLLLKTLPCLEQLDKSIGERLLSELQAEHILVSFPAKSLSGRGKGMPQNYTDHFERLIAGKPWRIERWQVKTEIMFLISRK